MNIPLAHSDTLLFDAAQPSSRDEREEEEEEGGGVGEGDGDAIMIDGISDNDSDAEMGDDANVDQNSVSKEIEAQACASINFKEWQVGLAMPPNIGRIPHISVSSMHRLENMPSAFY